MERVRSAPTLTTNCFALLVSLQWHVYGLAPVEEPSKKKKAAKAGTKQSEDAALAVFHQRLQQRNASAVPAEPPTGVCETATGSWTDTGEPVDKTIQKQFFAALGSVLSKKLVTQEEFVLTDDGFYKPNDAKFIFRCPSLTRLNHVEVYLEEEFPVPAFQLHFQLFEPSNLLTVTVDVVRRDGSLTSLGDELGDPRCSWERLVGLPSQKDHSVVDVWHLKDGLRRMDDSDGSGHEDEVKKDDNEEDADEEEEDNNQEAEVETDELLRRPVATGAAKAKRKRDSADSTENDESFVPCPQHAFNTPNATGPIIRMTLPHDDELQLHVDSEVRRFKRRRRGYKVKAGKEAAFSLTFGPVKSNGTGPNVKTEPLALSSNGEALDGRPVKTHPLLQALQDYVDDETKMMEKSLTASVSAKVKFLPNAEAFIPPPLRATAGRLSTNRATAEQLRLRLNSDRFKFWRSEYTKLQYPKNRQQKKEQLRRLLLDFDEAAFEEQACQESLKLWSNSDSFKLRDAEISLGIQMSASDAMVTWRQEPNGIKTWSAHSSLQVTAASTAEKNDVADRVQPYLLSLILLLKKGDKNESDVRKAGRDRRWMSFEDFTQAPTKSSDARRIERVWVEEEPKVCVSTLESSYHVEPAIISEYLLRDLHPVAALKPVDYVIVCPQSPSQWLASLALSYFTCFRSMYAQCHMGDLAPVDLSSVEGNHYANVDAANGLLLVDCAESMKDPFANFRAAGKVLNPVLSSGAIKKTQVFQDQLSVIDVKHKMWALGAFSSGLFGTESIAEVSEWKDSVTIEMVYLDDLYEVEVNPSPFMLMPNCSVCTTAYARTEPQPVDGVPSGAGRSRFLCERLYHLADWRADTSTVDQEGEKELPYIYGGYLLSEDRKWIACSCTDAVGSVLETYMISVKEEEDKGLENALLEMLRKMLQFFTLFGEKSVFVITRLALAVCMGAIRSNRLEELIPPAYTPLLSCVLLVQLTAASYDEVQLREDPSSTALYVSDNLGFAVISPEENTAARDSSRAVYFTGSNTWKATTLLHGQHTLAQKREARVLKVTLVHILLEEDTASKDGEVTESASPSMMTAILRDFHAQSYLTMHPITMERQSPLPHHLAAISKMSRELQQPGSPEDSTAKFRNKILGLSVVAEQNSAVPPFDEYGNAEQKDIVTQMNEELARRQESYVRRERQYKALLSDSRAKKSKENTLDASMDRVRTMHRNILDSVDQVQDQQEKDLLRAFRARLYSVQEELESEKNKTDDGASAWIEKSKQLETEVEWTKELADRLDRLNQSLTRENQRLKTQFSTQENDREFLVKQLVTVKKDNVSLRTELEALRQQLDLLRESGQPQQQQHHHPQSQTLFATASTSSLPKVHYRDSATSLALAQRPNTAGVSTLAMASDSDNRYKEIIKRLKRLLEVERRNLQQVRTAYKLELQNHTELEMILKECMQDIRGEIAHVSQLPLVMPQHSSSSLLGSPQHGRQSESRLSSSERLRLVEKLLEKEQLLNLLTAKAFPVRNGKRRGDPLLTGEAVSPDEVAKLLSNVSNFSDGRERQ
ncbi:Mediator complex, subunit Med13 [Phytophthora cactorum]|nr:Mediator complex, subunit Med13 [Phytophthora cactorum]